VVGPSLGNSPRAQLWGYTMPTSKPPPEFLEEDARDKDGKKAEPRSNPEYERWFAKDSQV